MIKKYFKPVALSSLALALAAPAALANITSLTIDAEVAEIVSLEIETAGNIVVSGDDIDPSSSAPATNEVLDFGMVDPLGINLDTLAAANTASGTLARRLLISDTFQNADTYNGAPPATTDGALYYVSGGYQLRAFRNDGTASMDVDVAVTGATALDALVDLNTANAYTVGDTIAGTSLRAAGAGPSSLITAMPLNTPELIDLGVFVPMTQAAGATSTVITFTGT
jgi:hypothetical protein